MPHCEYVTLKIAVFYSCEKSVNHWDTLASPVSSGQEAGIEVIFLASSKNGEYAHINIIPCIWRFPRNGKFSQLFFPNIYFCQHDEIVLKIILITQRFHFRRKNTNRVKNVKIIQSVPAILAHTFMYNSIIIQLD